VRHTFGVTLAELAEKDSSILLIVGDYGYSVIDPFKSKFPDRYFNLGVCEQSMISIAAGLALSGFKPYVYSITPFILERPFEQVKLDIDRQDVNVKLIGFGDYPRSGPTHQALDTKKLTELFINIVSYFPKDVIDTRNMIIESYASKKPTFIDLGRDKR
jgi:transketolase